MDAAGLLEMYEHLISRWHGAEAGRLTAAVSISAPQRVSVAYFEAIDDLSRRHGLPLFAHMNEQGFLRPGYELRYLVAEKVGDILPMLEAAAERQAIEAARSL